MRSVGLIPARMESTRFPGKPLVDLCGKPMIYHVWKQAKKSSALDDVFVATDSLEIKNAVESFGGKVLMTSSEHQSGTDRLAEASQKTDAEIIVNVQGDEPLINPDMITDAVNYMKKNKDVYFLTLARKINESDYNNPNVAKVVLDKNGDALYFSRSSIPFLRKKESDVYKNIGFYIYRKSFLLEFSKLKQSPLEKTECLEQLRALENCYKLRVLKTKHDSIGVDTPADLEKVRLLMKNENKKL